MTGQEHQLMMSMFARVNERIGTLVEVLRSREVLLADDAKAFSQLVHHDEKKRVAYFSQAKKDYMALVSQLGVEVPTL